MGSRVELFEQIRRDRRLEEMSIRELADRHGVHRRTVRQALASSVPPPRQTYPARARPAIDPWREVIDGWLIGDQAVHRKQRHTARRVWQRLVAEHGASVSEVTVSRYVGLRRVELGIVDQEVFVAQEHPPGAEAEVDFGEFQIVLDGVVVKVWMFVMRLSCSGKAFHVAYGNQAQEAFLEGHTAAFEHFGGVPGRIRYDNLKPAVTRVLKGRDREESERFIALRSHYGFDSFFCIPGKQGAHEKGGVEGEIGRFRRRHLVPPPKIATLVELAALVAAGDVTDDDRVITGRTSTVGAAFATECAASMAHILVVGTLPVCRRVDSVSMSSLSWVGLRGVPVDVPVTRERRALRLSRSGIEVGNSTRGTSCASELGDTRDAVAAGGHGFRLDDRVPDPAPVTGCVAGVEVLTSLPELLLARARVLGEGLECALGASDGRGALVHPHQSRGPFSVRVVRGALSSETSLWTSPVSRSTRPRRGGPGTPCVSQVPRLAGSASTSWA